MKANSGCGLAEMPLYRAFALMLVKVKGTFRKYAIGTGDDTYFTDVRCMMVEKCLKVKNSQNKYVKSWQPF